MSFTRARAIAAEIRQPDPTVPAGDPDRGDGPPSTHASHKPEAERQSRVSAADGEATPTGALDGRVSAGHHQTTPASGDIVIWAHNQIGQLGVVQGVSRDGIAYVRSLLNARQLFPKPVGDLTVVATHDELVDLYASQLGPTS